MAAALGAKSWGASKFEAPIRATSGAFDHRYGQVSWATPWTPSQSSPGEPQAMMARHWPWPRFCVPVASTTNVPTAPELHWAAPVALIEISAWLFTLHVFQVTGSGVTGEGGAAKVPVAVNWTSPLG